MTDLQKPFTDEQLKIWAALSKKYYFTRCLDAERFNYVPYSHPDHGDCLVASPDLAARVIELEAENKRLRDQVEGLKCVLTQIEDMEYINQLSGNMNFERAPKLARAALNQGAEVFTQLGQALERLKENRS